MAVDVSFKVEKSDIASLQKAMSRASRDLNLKQPQAIKMAMTHVLSALAKSTAISSPYREYEDKGLAPRSKVGNKIYVVKTKYQTPRRKGKSLRRSWQGNFREQKIYARNERELKRRPAVIIAMRGVARQSWMEAGKKSKLKLTSREVMGIATAGQIRAAKNKRIMRKAARRWVSYKANLKGSNAYIQVTNRIRHISAATSPSSLSQAMSVAASKMENKIDGIIKRRLAS
jgi:hypothetical protein